ncbi:peptide deformylase [Tropicibacter naphthalenivorans]|uniref:Peptide deformylase n=1 Tax=Tropicibacter naphthalenivorans TaxID=441103 RepID=A0A0N7LZC5_9RHOB|nr:peptide deformylase [Tropicibacter naphthalenivorans]CUH77281.1 Peptide deformylase [Tropicibacter naphthalenivorans]SMC59255.1 peptide deformylase [Tropicibacter naphthalenivorans]
MTDAPILPIDHPLMSEPSDPVTDFDGFIAELADEMFEVMDMAGGQGLAAVQIGVPLRLIVVDMPDAMGEQHRMALANPRIIARSDTMETREEGCLSLPDHELEVPRYTHIEVAFTHLTGEDDTLIAHGPLAVALQHEIDHTDGILFFDRVARLRRSRAAGYFAKPIPPQE